VNASPNNRLIKGFDLVVDFATLGEYRVITDAPRREVASRDLWATDIEWSAPVRNESIRGVECKLPRARDRRLARDRVRG
jgi:hypothetical protein